MQRAHTGTRASRGSPLGEEVRGCLPHGSHGHVAPCDSLRGEKRTFTPFVPKENNHIPLTKRDGIRLSALHSSPSRRCVQALVANDNPQRHPVPTYLSACTRDTGLEAALLFLETGSSPASAPGRPILTHGDKWGEVLFSKLQPAAFRKRDP